MILAKNYIMTLLMYPGRQEDLQIHSGNSPAIILKENEYMKGFGIGGTVIDGVKVEVLTEDWHDHTELWFVTDEDEIAFKLKYTKDGK